VKRSISFGILFLSVLLLVGCSVGTGSLIIQTDPTGANVYIANKYQGTTPLSIPEIRAGGIRITFKKPGYQDKSVAVTVQDGQQSIVNEELVPTFEHLVDQVSKLDRPESPVQMLLMKFTSAINTDSSYYWHSATHYGLGEFFIKTFESTVKSNFSTLTDRDAKSLAAMFGLPSLWETRFLDEDAALVNSPQLKLTVLVAVEDGAWKLLRLLKDDEPFETVPYETVLANTEEFLMTITGTSMFLELLSDENVKQLTEEQESSPLPVPTTPKWTTIKGWSGKGSKQTETFEINNHEWQIEWNADNEEFFGLLVVYLYKENGSLVSIPVTQTGEGSGSTYVRGAGRYYLQIDGANIDWEVKVLDYK